MDHYILYALEALIGLLVADIGVRAYFWNVNKKIVKDTINQTRLETELRRFEAHLSARGRTPHTEP
jgi:hypothetical protein